MTELQSLIARCLSDRFQSAREIADAATRSSGRTITIQQAHATLKVFSERGQCEATMSREAHCSIRDIRPVRMYRRIIERAAA